MNLANSNLRVDLAEPVPEQLERLLDGNQTWVELDAETRVEGFDRNGVATIDVGDEVVVTARLCEGEVPGPLADLIEPAA